MTRKAYVSVVEVLSSTSVPLQSWLGTSANVTSSFGKKRSLVVILLLLSWDRERPLLRDLDLLLPLVFERDRSESWFFEEGREGRADLISGNGGSGGRVTSEWNRC